MPDYVLQSFRMTTTRFNPLAPPLAVLATAKLAGVAVEPNVDANLPKDSVPVITLPDGFVHFTLRKMKTTCIISLMINIIV